jgi:hypothetical protein
MLCSLKSGTILIAALALTLLAHENALAQCHGGRSMSTSMQQSRMQTAGQQTMLQTNMLQQQQNALAAMMQQQQNALMTGTQQQQLAALTALPQLQQLRQLLAMQQQQNGLLTASGQQPAGFNNLAPVRRRRRISTENSDFVSPPSTRQASDLGNLNLDPAVALQMAKEIAADANQAQSSGERSRAAKLRSRASERLQRIVEENSGTSLANEASDLMQALNR